MKKETIFYPSTVPNQITTQEFVIRKSTGTERKMLINTNFLWYFRFKIASCCFYCPTVKWYNYWLACCIEVWPGGHEFRRSLSTDNGDFHRPLWRLIQHFLYLDESSKQRCSTRNGQKWTENIHAVFRS